MTVGELRKRLMGMPASLEIWTVSGEYLRPVGGASLRRIHTLEAETPGGFVDPGDLPSGVVLLLRMEGDEA